MSAEPIETVQINFCPLLLPIIARYPREPLEQVNLLPAAPACENVIPGQNKFILPVRKLRAKVETSLPGAHEYVAAKTKIQQHHSFEMNIADNRLEFFLEDLPARSLRELQLMGPRRLGERRPLITNDSNDGDSHSMLKIIRR